MNLIRLSPLRELEDTRRFFNRFFDDSISRFFDEATRTWEGGTWTPAVDVYETENEIVYTVELPGFEKDDVNISVDEGRLIISGERKFEKESKHNYHQVERWYGNFYRSFLLPTTVDEEKISAQLKNGLLKVVLPKKEEARPRQIPVSV